MRLKVKEKNNYDVILRAPYFMVPFFYYIPKNFVYYMCAHARVCVIIVLY